MEVTFKYKIGQLVFYNGHLYEVLARMHFETKWVRVNKYNLKNVDGCDINEYEPNVWEDDIKTLREGKIMNIYEKLVEIKKDIKGFNKDTKGFGFEYVSGSQVLRAVRGKMNELGVLLIPSVDYDTMSWEKHEYVTKKGEKKLDFIVTMKMNYTWVNAEDPNDKIVVPWVCMGQQTDDISKAVGTAMTYNERYFLLKFLGLPTDEDDADAKGVGIKPNMTPVGGLSEAQIKRLFAIGNKAGFKKDVVEATVKKMFGCEPKDMTKDQYNTVCERLEKKVK